MKKNILEYIILYVLLSCAALIVATVIRISALLIGFDNFTTFIIFLVVLGVEVVIYLSIHVVLQELMLPWIQKALIKIPFFKSKITSTQQPNLKDIRKKQEQNRSRQQEEKLSIALFYTRKTFAPYATDESIDLLCENIKLYANKSSIENLYSIKTTKDLSTIDIFHFGWNIWNYFKITRQIEIACFLKKVFPEILKDAEIESIKSHLKDEEQKGLIKIQENIVE